MSPPTFQYSLHNLNNYSKNISQTNEDILHKYTLLVAEYLHFISDKFPDKSDNNLHFIIMRGLRTITHVFTIILLYSKNPDMAYYHSQKSYYFYVEFIQQTSGDQHVFLQLTSRDASMFVYKKTIFEMNNDTRKNGTSLTIEDKSKMNVLNIETSIIQNTTVIFIKIYNKDYMNRVKKICNLLYKSRIDKDAMIAVDLYIENLCDHMNLIDISNNSMGSSSHIETGKISENGTYSLIESYIVKLQNPAKK